MTRHTGRSSWRVLTGAALLALGAAQCGQGKTLESGGPDGSGGQPGLTGSGGRPAVIATGGRDFIGGTGGEVASCSAEADPAGMFPTKLGTTSTPRFPDQGQTASPPP